MGKEEVKELKKINDTLNDKKNLNLAKLALIMASISATLQLALIQNLTIPQLIILIGLGVLSILFVLDFLGLVNAYEDITKRSKKR